RRQSNNVTAAARSCRALRCVCRHRDDTRFDVVVAAVVDDIENEAVLLVAEQAQTSAEHLLVEHVGKGGAGHEDAVDRRNVDALGEDLAVYQKRKPALFELNRGALLIVENRKKAIERMMRTKHR